MLSEMNQERYKALRLLADHIRTPSRDLSLNAIPKTGIFFDNNFIAGASILHGRHHEAKKLIA